MIEISLPLSDDFVDAWLAPMMSVLLGALLVWGYDYVKEFQKRNQIKKVIKDNLKELLKDLPEIVKNYQVLRDKTENHGIQKAIMVFRHFNSDVYRSNALTEYPRTFSGRKQYILLIKIYNLVEVIAKKMPYDLWDFYWNEFSRLRDRYPEVGTKPRNWSIISVYHLDIEDLRNRVKSDVDGLIDECIEVENLINKFLAKLD